MKIDIRTLTSAILIALVLSWGGCAKKQGGSTTAWEAEVKAESGPVEVVVRVEKKTITLAETFRVQIEAMAKDGYEVTMPPASQILKDGNYGLRDWRDMGKKLDAQNRLVRTVDIELDPFVSGEPNVPGLEFKFHKVAADPNEAAREYSVSTEPIDLKVTSLSSEPNAIGDIADIEPVMDMPGQFRAAWWTVGIAAAIVAVVGGWFLLRRKGQAGLMKVMVPAHELAYQRLRELVAEDLVGQGRVKEFYERVSNILRHYIEDRFELRAPERTTEEFLYELQGSGVLEARDKDRLKDFMTSCDLVKFAKFQPEAGDIQKVFDLAREFIEKTRSDVKVVEQPAAAQAEGAA
jgi:hypothetical protein